MPTKPEIRRSPTTALLYGVPIGLLGGLSRLGGEGFRLPVLAGAFGYPARRAVALNIAISLITVASALANRVSERLLERVILAFGVGIKTVGTASLLISLPTVAVGVLRHRRLGSYTERADLT